jgi:hypothetical protein
MAAGPAQSLRLLVITGLLGFVTPTWSTAQTHATDPNGLYGDDTGAYVHPPAAPREGEFRRRTPQTTSTPRGLYDDDYELGARLPSMPALGEFRRRVPESTSSRFAPDFRGYMRASGSEPNDDDPIGAKERTESRLPYDFANGRDDEPGFRPDRAGSRFSEAERGARQDSYVQYLKERDPARRAQLYREYLGTKSKSTGDRPAPRDPSEFSRNASASQPSFGFGFDRGRSITERESPSSSSPGPTAPRSSLFSTSRARGQDSPALFRRGDESATRKSAGASSRRPSSSPTSPAGRSRSAGQGLESGRDR